MRTFVIKGAQGEAVQEVPILSVRTLWMAPYGWSLMDGPLWMVPYGWSLRDGPLGMVP